MTKELILKTLCTRFDLAEEEITFSANLFEGEIDSLDFLEYARTIDALAKTHHLPFEIKDFLYSECYSINDIYLYLSKKTNN